MALPSEKQTPTIYSTVYTQNKCSSNIRVKKFKYSISYSSSAQNICNKAVDLHSLQYARVFISMKRIKVFSANPYVLQAI